MERDNGAMKDSFGRAIRDLRISVTDRCNYRCPYCMPASQKYNFLPMNRLLSYDQIETVARAFVQCGVEKLRITGGEPLLRKNLHELVARLAQIDGVQELALTTNAHFLAEQAKDLKDAGLNRITVSLDALDPEMAARMSGGRCDLPAVLRGIDAAASQGLPVKLNAVLKKGENDGEIIPLIEYARAHGHIIRFIEFMDVGNLNSWDMKHVIPSRDLVRIVNETYPCEPVGPNYFGEVASRYRFRDGKGEFGVISSVTQPFCRSCTRARVSAKGVMYTCLFASGGHDLKPLLETEDPENRLVAEIRRIWGARADRYSEQRFSGQAVEKVEMFEMGG